MASSLSICNEALVFLGESALLTFPETSANSDLCEKFYDRVKRAELSKHPWNFATKRVALSRDATNPPYEYAYQFVLPADYLRILDIWPKGYKWKREGQRLLVNLSTVSIKYIYNVDEAYFTPAFSAVVSARLASLIAETATERAEKVQQAQQWYVAASSEAKLIDSYESSVDEQEDTSVVDVRTNIGEPYRYRQVNT